MSVEAYKIGVKYAKNLAKRGKVDRDSSWSFTADDAGRLLGFDGEDLGHFSKFHLGGRSDVAEDSKDRWAFPFGKDGKVFRSAVLDAIEHGDGDVKTAASEILAIIDQGGSVESVERSVRSDFFDWRDWQTSKMEKTPEGYLKGRTVVTNVGVFGYRNADGTMRYELRHPDDVFDPESLASLDGKPLTNDHPTEGVDPENVQALSVGTVHSPSHDAYHVSTGIIIHRADALSDVGGGKMALSCGYTADVIPERGVYLGVPYTHRQKNIRYNHVALVDEGRAGDAARLRMDGVKVDHNENPTKGEKMAKIKLDSGVEFDVPEAVGSHVDALAAKSTELKTSLDAAEVAITEVKKALDAKTAEADGNADRVKALEKELLEKTDAAVIEGLLEKRLGLITLATSLGVQNLDAKSSERDIRLAVIALDTADSMEGKSDAYIEARFDVAVANRKNRKPADEPGGESHADGALGKQQNDALAAAYDTRRKTLNTAWMRKEN